MGVFTSTDEESRLEINTVIDTLWKVLRNTKDDRNDIRKFILILIIELLKYDEFLGKLSIDYDNLEVFSPLIKFLDLEKKDNDKNNSSDESLKILSIYILVNLLINIKSIEFTSQIFDALNQLLLSTNFNLNYFSIQLICELASIKFNSEILVSNKLDVVKLIFKKLDENVLLNSFENIQYQYKSLLVIWILTFNSKFNDKFLVNFSKNLNNLVKLLKISIKEKILRLILSILLNLSNNSIEFIKYLILSCDILPILNNLKFRKFSDEELIEDLNSLIELIEINYSKLTSFDEYEQELNSGEFKNSPVHLNDEFFIDNLKKFQENNYKNFKKLINYLNLNGNSKSQAIILSDLLKILKFDPKSIIILEKSGLKQKVMELLNHHSSDVRYSALKITQFIVSQSFK